MGRLGGFPVGLNLSTQNAYLRAEEGLTSGEFKSTDLGLDKYPILGDLGVSFLEERRSLLLEK